METTLNHHHVGLRASNIVGYRKRVIWLNLTEIDTEAATELGIWCK